MAVKSSSKLWMFIGGGVVAAVALVIGFQNYPPQPKDAAGAIGAAQRHHEPQITGDDVKVSQDELATWIQSETFDRIVKDPQARKLFTDAAVQKLFTNAGMDQAKKHYFDLLPPDQARGHKIAIADAGMDQGKKHYFELLPPDQLDALVMSNDALSAALNNKEFCQALLNDSLRTALTARVLLAETGGDLR